MQTLQVQRDENFTEFVKKYEDLLTNQPFGFLKRNSEGHPSKVEIKYARNLSYFNDELVTKYTALVDEMTVVST